MAEPNHELLESTRHFFAFCHCALKKILVKFTHQPEASALIEEVEFGL